MKSNCLLLALVAASISIASSGQEKKNFAVGAILYGDVINPKSEKDYSDGLSSKYTAKRRMFALEALYGVGGNWEMSTAVGLSLYKSSARYSSAGASGSVENSVSEPYLMLLHRIMYNFGGLRFGENDFLQMKFKPFVGIEYDQNIGTKEEEGGFDLSSQDAQAWVSERQLPAISYKNNIPSGIFSVNGGLSVEFVFAKKIGVHYDIGYSYAITGHSKMEVTRLYKDGQTQAEMFESKDCGFTETIGVRYYF